jgi:hypothetical protein
MSIKCFVFGHNESLNDFGSPVCSCGSHSYYCEFYDDKLDIWIWKYGGLFGLFKYLLSNIYYHLIRKHYYLCLDCGKVEMLFGKPFGNHKECIPF